MNGNDSAGAEINLRASAQLFKLDIQDMINASQRSKPVRAGMPHASNIVAPDSKFCMRSLVLAATQPEAIERPPAYPWEDLMNARFLHGWAIHEKYQNLLRKYGDILYYNDNQETPELDHTHYDPERMLYFSPDAIIRHCGEVMPVEMKGYNNTTWLGLDELGLPPLDAHLQVCLYMYLLACSYGLILVENKDNQAMKVWCVKYDQKVIQPYIDRVAAFKLAYNAAQEGKPLPRRTCKSAVESRAKACNACSLCFAKDAKR